MKRLALLTGILTLAGPLALAQTSTWVPDKAHSEVDFSILHMGLSYVNGRFGNIGGNITFDESDITKSTVNVTIDVTSVDTGVSGRDNDLKSANVFDAAQFPTATFVSTSVAKKRQWSHCERQSDSSWSYEASDTCSGGPNGSRSGHGP